MKKRHVVLALLVVLSVITYLDRVCIAIAGPRMQSELDISPDRWGWILGAFVLSYGLFEIPTGALGDRLGQRKVLTRIVVWWSAFTSLTGMVSHYWLLLATRFLFGAGEAGAYPNMAGSVGRWFPAAERARAQGFVWAASRLGGAISPWLVVPLMSALGWRAAFWTFGAFGLLWAVVWWVWYRDHPRNQPGISQEELAEIGVLVPLATSWHTRHATPDHREVESGIQSKTNSASGQAHPSYTLAPAGGPGGEGVSPAVPSPQDLRPQAPPGPPAAANVVLGWMPRVGLMHTDYQGVPWGKLFRSPQLWLIMAMYWCYVWGSMFYLTWFPTYLVKGRGFSEGEMGTFAALPFLLGTAGNLVGGFLSDGLARKYGLRVGRRLLGSVSLALSALFLLATALTTGKAVAVVLLALGFGAMDCMLPSAWAVCLDVGREYAGAVSGAMNSAGQAGGFVCSILFGYLIQAFGDYDVPLFVIAAMVLISAGLYGLIDPTRPLVPSEEKGLPVGEPACV
jgi:MFS family permease